MRNIYKHFAIMMTILICVSLVSATMASGYDNTTNGEADIKSTIESYFDLQYEILSKLDIEERKQVAWRKKGTASAAE